MLVTMAANLQLQRMRKMLADRLVADKEKKLGDERAAWPDLTTEANVSDLSWFNNILRLIEDVQAEICVEIAPE